MMNFLTNVTNDARQESGAGPVVEVPVGTVMRFPFASHFCFAQAQSLTEEQLRRMSDREEQLRNRLEAELALEYPEPEVELVTTSVVEAERELPELELGPDLMSYEPGQLEYLDSLSPEELESLYIEQRARTRAIIQEMEAYESEELDEIDDDLENDVGEELEENNIRDEREENAIEIVEVNKNDVMVHAPNAPVILPVEEIVAEADEIILPFVVDFGVRNQHVLQQLDWKTYAMARQLQKVLLA